MSTPSTGKIQKGLQGVREIKEASLYYIIIFLVVLVIAVILYGSILAINPSSIHHQPGMSGPSALPSIPGALIGILIIAIIVALIMIILALYALFGKLLPGASKLAEYNPNYSTAASLMKTGFIGGFILLIIGLATLVIFIGVFLIILALIFLLTARIGLAVLCFKLNDEFNEGAILGAGIVFIISIFLNIDFIGWILLYAGLGSVEKKLEEKLREAEAQQPGEETGVIL